MSTATPDIDILPAQPFARQEGDVVSRVAHSLDQLQQLAELLAVEDGYVPAVRDFIVPKNFKLSVVIPVYNEERTIQQVLTRVAALPVPKEIVIVDDASTDGTRQILSQYECAADVHVIFKPQNEGKGAALRTAFRRVTGDVVIVQDADLEYDPRDIMTVIKPIVCGEADVVYGSRFLKAAGPLRVPATQNGTWSGPTTLVHRLGNRLLTAASNTFTGLRITDMETCYKAFRRDVIRSFEIQQHRFGFEPEVTAKIARRKLRVVEAPVSYTARGYAEGKKIGIKDLCNALFCIVRYGMWD